MHNRYAVIASLLCFIGALAGWLLFYGLVVGLTLGFFTICYGQEVLSGQRFIHFPHWLNLAALIIALLLLYGAMLDQRIHRYKPTRDRPLVGWHIFLDVLLVPARLTLGIWNYLSAMIYLNSDAQLQAFELLQHIYEEKKCRRTSLGAHFSDIPTLSHLLRSLQLLGWLDLHRSDDDWFYIIPSNELEDVSLIISKNTENASI